jgi:hypothetical protein
VNLTLPQLSALGYASGRERVTVRDPRLKSRLGPAEDALAVLEFLARHGLLSVSSDRGPRSYSITAKGRSVLVAMTAPGEGEPQP